MGSCAGIQLAERPPFYDQFILQEKIGQGSYGKVYLVKDKKSHKTLAAKVQAAQFGREWVILDEVAVWKILGRHPNVVWLHDMRQEANVYFIIMEVCPRALSDRVMSSPKWTAAELMNDFQQALLGIQHMHVKRIVHRDIKVQNFLYGGPDGRTLKLADFGLSVEIHPGGKLEAVCGSPAFMAPEMVLRQGYDFKIDMWSMGVTFFMVMYGTLLVGKPKMSVVEMKEAIKSPMATKSAMATATMKAESVAGELRDMKVAALDVVRQLTIRDPILRLGPREALNLRFLQLGINATWEQKLRYEQVLLVDRAPTAKKKAVTESNVPASGIAAGLPKQKAPDFNSVMPQAADETPGTEPKSEAKSPGLKQRARSSHLVAGDFGSEERRPSTLELPHDISRGRAGESSLRVQRFKSMGEISRNGKASAEFGNLAESGDSIRLSVAACLMQAYRGGSRRLLDSGLPSMRATSGGVMSPDSSYALGNFAESFGHQSDEAFLRRFAPATSPGMSCRSPAGLTVPGAMNIAQLREVQASSGAPAVKDPSSNSGPSGEQLESLNQERPARLPGEVSGEMSDLQLHKG